MASEHGDRGRVACVELPALPLQLLLRDRPKWCELPVAVVEADQPQAKLLWINERARRPGVLPGMRLAAARSFVPELRAAPVSEDRITAAIEELFTVLLDFSPRIQPGLVDEPGTFWVDPSGMTLLWGELEQWALAIEQALGERGLLAVVVVGFHRFRSLAIARNHARLERGEGQAWVIPDPRREARMAARVALDRLGISARLRDELAALGVRTLGEFLALPGAELPGRFGAEADRLHRRARGDSQKPMQARELVDPVATARELEPPEGDTSRLLFRIKPALDELLERLADRGSAMSALHLRLHLDHAGAVDERIEPAAPTLDTAQLLELLQLRVAALELRAPVERFELELEGQRTNPRQIALFRARARRDLEAAERALARLRASLGPRAVTRPRLVPAHLPEARLAWTPTTQVEFPSRQRMEVEGDQRPRVRRLLARPQPIPSRERRHNTDGWVIDASLGPVVRSDGPFRASGGWWVREVERDYYYATTKSGVVLWVFYDRPRRRWYLHGWVE